MNRFRLIVQPRAEAEVLAAFDWIAEPSPNAAAHWLTGLREAVAKIADQPMLHPLAVEVSEPFRLSIRQALYGKRRGIYRILDTIEDDVIHILAIRHAAQDEPEP